MLPKSKMFGVQTFTVGSLLGAACSLAPSTARHFQPAFDIPFLSELNGRYVRRAPSVRVLDDMPSSQVCHCCGPRPLFGQLTLKSSGYADFSSLPGRTQPRVPRLTSVKISQVHCFPRGRDGAFGSNFCIKQPYTIRPLRCSGSLKPQQRCRESQSHGRYFHSGSIASPLCGL
ncbi:hypothetical protein C8Q80DRAFT_346301 [Daedaleopsis nitida]|nr:hypothetical protein C8Q80DRAFT_346301 [Daedaleopsis nitida]